jgi:EmrB/QacA subfamily drug resistance transporter
MTQSQESAPARLASAKTQAGPHEGRQARLTLAVVCISIFMLLLDVTVVVVALADIQKDLGGGLDVLQWVVDAYTLGLAGILMTAATLGDRIGRRRVFTLGLATFTAASGGCAVAGSPLVLDAVRGVQGIGGALIMGTSLPLLHAAFTTPAGRARAIGAFGATLAAATAIGPLVGGLLVGGPGWRWIFLLNLPIGLLTLVATRRLAESRAGTARRADWPGTLLLTGGLLALLLGLVRGNPDGWSSPRVTLLLGVGGLALVGFLVREVTAREPMLELSMLRRPAYAGVVVGAFVMGSSLLASTTYLALYLQNGLGYGPLSVGLRFLPLTIAAFVAAPLAAELLHRVPLGWLVAASLTLVAVGMLGMSCLDASSGYASLAGWFIPAGLGFGASGAVLSAGALAGAEQAKAGMASGLMNTMRQVGLAAGVAGLGALFQRVATDHGADRLAAAGVPGAAGHHLAALVGNGAGAAVAAAVPPSLRQAVAHAGRDATADALVWVMLVGGSLAAVAAVLCLVLMPTRPSTSRQDGR